MIQKGQRQEFDGEVFLEIVKTAFPQEACNKWSQVARKYYLQTGQRIVKTQELRRKFDILTKLDCKFTEEQKILMFRFDVLARGSKRLGLNNYKQEMQTRNQNQLIYQSQFYRCATSHLREAFRQVQELFDNHRKISNYDYAKSNNRREDKVALPSLYILLRVQDVLKPNSKILEQLNPEEKWIAEKMVQASILCERMLLLYCEMHLHDRPTRYNEFSKFVNRRSFKMFIFFLKYLDVLRKIHIENILSVTMQSHPLIHPNPKVNKKSLLYKALIVQNDWTDKYQLFHECIATQVLEEDMSMVISKNYKNVQQTQELELHKNKEMQVFKKLTGAKVIKAKKKQGEIAKFRGQFLTPGEFKNMDRLTRTFHFEDDSEYDEKEFQDLDMEAQKSRMDKLQELYHEAFLKIPNQKFQSYYSDK